MDNPFEGIFKALTNPVTLKIGEKLCNLTAEEIADQQINLAEAKRLKQRRDELDVDTELLLAKHQQWILTIKRDHNLQGKALHIEDGYVYEMIPEKED